MIYIPKDEFEAAARMQEVAWTDLKTRGKEVLLMAYHSLCWWCPVFHPDDVGTMPDSHLKPLVEEIWRRFELGQITEDELYPSDATLAGLKHLKEQNEQRPNL